ncbi:acetylxylan esterase [Accumulibacter sp.]|uniref:acetylxylan esterase n=1 Tax=Accumulibacter sp. TaxID=2053492 RepID=UPI00260D2025|nr:acetylxylan esterase [Accumulibacter sp.]
MPAISAATPGRPAPSAFHLWLRARKAAARQMRRPGGVPGAFPATADVGPHAYPFDPTYGYDLRRLCAVEPPLPPDGFGEFWQARYQAALGIDPQPRLRPGALRHAQFCVFDLEYSSSDGFTIGGWLLWPTTQPPRQAFVVGHGYGGIESPSFALPSLSAVYLFPCFRGIARSRRWPISDDPNYHVLHDIHLRERYIIAGCVEDLWTAVSALLQLAPQTAGHLGYLGSSLGGGVGALALACETRVARAHLKVPTFGHQALRLTLPTVGSAAAVQDFAQHHPEVAQTLAWYDAASAARFIRQPTLVAAALFDPAVAPPGQFAVYNALPGARQLFVLSAGHFPYAREADEEKRLLAALRAFFAGL